MFSYFIKFRDQKDNILIIQKVKRSFYFLEYPVHPINSRISNIFLTFMVNNNVPNNFDNLKKSLLSYVILTLKFHIFLRYIILTLKSHIFR